MKANRRKALSAISRERNRQVQVEGWGEDRDDVVHADGGLGRAAACYASPDRPGPPWERQGPPWPWHPDWDKRAKHSRLKQLAIAGALIVAEYERLLRAGHLEPGEEPTGG